MADQTLLEIVRERFGGIIESDSDAGRILGALAPQLPLPEGALTGQADLTELTLVPTAGGVSVRAAGGSDVLVLSVPAGPIAFTITPPAGAQPVSVALTLLTVTVPLSPPFGAAELTANGTLGEAAGDVVLQLPALLLVVTAGTAAMPATVRMAPAEGAGGGLEITMTLPYARIGPGTVVGFGFAQGTLALDDPSGPAILVSDVELFVAPPGVPALAMRGGGQDLRIALGDGGGLSGDFTLALAGAPAARPAFLRELACRLRLHRSTVTLAEISGEIDLHGEIERQLGGTLGDPDTGPTAFTLSLTLNGEAWRVALSLSGQGGVVFLWRTRRPGANSAVHNTLGAYAVFAPLLVPNLPGAGPSGYVDLVLGAGVAAGIGATGLVQTVSVTLFGAELVVLQPAGGPPEGFLFCDLETELDVVADPLLRTRRPLKVRHQAIGFRLDFGPDGANPHLAPVFDPARGFGFDLSDPGAFAVPGPLAEIVQPEGARMARQNPLMFETDLALKADLGVVTVERATIRVPIDPAGLPSITALGARVDIPGAFSGSGYLQVSESGFAGSLDMALTPLGIRVAAGLKIDQVADVTAVLTTLGVRLPIPIPLANSGLGIFGFLGLFGMHFQRQQPEGMTVLQWFTGPADYNAQRLEAWEAAPQHWALGLGTLLGTLEGGFILHAKGMMVIEAPGPRLLILMHADILSLPPRLESHDTGTLLALIEISPDALTIGIVLDYRKLEPILTAHVPVEAFFDFKQAANWHLDVGGIPPNKVPASVMFLNRLRAEGYLLLHGNGIDPFPLPPGKLEGFAVAAGVRVALTWGPKEIGLYLEIAAQADLGISFKPFLILGRMALSGELHLFIVGIEASAAATVTITPETFHILAEVCGKVDFFFFDVEGCVTFELGEKPQQLPVAEPLLRALSLHSRSPALLPGSGVDRAVDGSRGDAARVGDNGQPAGDLPVVPIDAIPVLQLEMAPSVAADCRFFETAVPPKLSHTDWVHRGRRAYRYTLKSVTLDPASGPGERPVVWWDRAGKGSADRDVQLALLSWVPDPTPAAAERTVSLDERMSHRWGTICTEPAAPAPVLWTFHGAVVGPSPTGWTRRGVTWPDAPDTWRSTPPPDLLRVSEPWRSGTPLADGLVQVAPAIAFGTPGIPERALLGPRTGAELRPAVADDEQLAALVIAVGQHGGFRLADAVRIDAGGLTRVRLLLAIDPIVWEAGLLRLRALDASGGETGFVLPIDTGTTASVGSLADLPGAWSDPAGPWQAPAAAAVTWAASALSDQHLRLVLVECALLEGTTQIEIGAEGEVSNIVQVAPEARYWGVILVEGSSLAEALRFEHDQTMRQSEIDVINGALGADQAKRALLAPNTAYTVSVTYDVAIADVDDKGGVMPAGSLTDQVQRFRFQTDNAPPARLDPWVLATDPAPTQQAFFWGDPIRIVLATNAVRALFKAYGRDLFAIVRAASGRQPPETAGFDPSQVALDATVNSATPLTAFAVSPWESAIGEVVAGVPCVEHNGQSVRHERITLNMLLEPNTEYILDLEARPVTGNGLHPLFRRHFATGRYQSAAAFAAAVHETPPRHRHLANPAPLAALGAGAPDGVVAFARDLDFEQALRAAAWGDLARPGAPWATVIWQGGAGAAPQPFALLLEAPEPFWRQREVPKEVTDAAGTHRFQMVTEPWLEIAPTPAAAQLVARLVVATAGNRALVLLRPGARGGTLTLALRRRHHPLFEGDSATEGAGLVTADLTRALWED